MLPGMTACIAGCISSPAFMEQWSSMRGMSLATSPIGVAVDRATGYGDVIAETLIRDIYDLVWCRLPESVREEMASGCKEGTP